MLLLVFPAAFNNWGFIISQCFLRAAVISDTFLLLLYNFIFFLYCDPSDDLDFLIPPSPDYICICVADAPSKWNLTMRRPTTEANFCKLESENFKLTIENWECLHWMMQMIQKKTVSSKLWGSQRWSPIFTNLKLKIRHWKLKIPKNFSILAHSSVWCIYLITIDYNYNWKENYFWKVSKHIFLEPATP